MIPDLSTALSWLKAHPQSLRGIHRGIEREGLRVNFNGNLSQSLHPKFLGSALTHKWITTDFSESLLEFITPADDDIDHMFEFLSDIHRYVMRNLNNEYLWPMSMPCRIDNTQDIRLAQYGSSNTGRMKTVYRKGLKNRYGALMQVIAGIHYNFSFPMSFWKSYTGINDEVSGKEVISNSYLRMIRNYYRFGWIIPYFFGASPGICPSFLNGRTTDFSFKHAPSGLLYLPYATSLRLSNLGYTNKAQSQLGITFNCLDEYICGLRKAVETPYDYYQRMGLKRNGCYLQLNTNVLQNENELYVPIRPKRARGESESPSDALMRGGIEYVEVRSLDINPFSLVGIEKEQVRFLDLFLIWCMMAEAPKMSAEEIFYSYSNWDRVILEGRKPGLVLYLSKDSAGESLTTIGKLIIKDLLSVAAVLDSNSSGTYYQQVCNKLVASFDCPELTLSARFLDQLIKNGISKLGMILADGYSKVLRTEPLQVLSDAQLNNERLRSLQKQYALESENNTLSFDDFFFRKDEKYYE